VVESLMPLGLPDLTVRRIEPELMDSPTLDQRAHLMALDALARVNAVSLSARRMWAEIERLAAMGMRPVRVLDVACGGGDVLLSLGRRARRLGIDVDLHGCDVSALAVERARKRGGNALGLELHERDVLSEPIPEGFHLVGTSLFLHHLSCEDAPRVLAAMANAAENVLLVQDLRRSRLGLIFARIGLGVLTRSAVAKHDGPVSVAAAFTLGEAGALCREAGLANAEVRACWPQRLTIRWARA
jgi:SAM-dependent methyltransferase